MGGRSCAAVLLLGAAAACGGARAGDPQLYGVDVQIERGADSLGFLQRIVSDAQFSRRLGHVLSETAEYLGRDPEEFAGLRIVLTGDPVPCASGGCLGRYDAGDETMYVYAASPCLESLVIPHEIVHYFEGDPLHQSPQFALHYFDELWAHLHASGTNGCDAVPYTGDWAGSPGQP